MKKLLLSSFSILVLTTFLITSQTSCEKDKDTDSNDPCTPTIQGLWTGAHQNTSGAGQAWSCSIRADGTASYENTINGTRQLCVGTWKLTNGTWTCSTTCIYGVPALVGATQTFTATYNATTGTLTNGTYVTITPAPDSGTFTLVEVN